MTRVPDSGCPHCDDPCNCSPSTARSSRPLGANYSGIASFDLRSSVELAEVLPLRCSFRRRATTIWTASFRRPDGTDYNHFSIAAERDSPIGGLSLRRGSDMPEAGPSAVQGLDRRQRPDRSDGRRRESRLDGTRRPTTSTTSASPRRRRQPSAPRKKKCKKKRAAAAKKRSARRSGARRSEADQRRIDGAVPPALVDRLADRQVLDGEAGRIEERDLVGRLPARRLPDQDVTELAHVL